MGTLKKIKIKSYFRNVKVLQGQSDVYTLDRLDLCNPTYKNNQGIVFRQRTFYSNQTTLPQISVTTYVRTSLFKCRTSKWFTLKDPSLSVVLPLLVNPRDFLPYFETSHNVCLGWVKNTSFGTNISSHFRMWF